MFVNEWRKELARLQGRVVHNVETGVSWDYGYYYAVAGKIATPHAQFNCQISDQ